MSEKIVSPCISICKADPITRYCYGCARTNNEKKIWKDKNLNTNETDLKLWWDKINKWKKIDCLHFTNNEKDIKQQYGIQQPKPANKSPIRPTPLYWSII